MTLTTAFQKSLNKRGLLSSLGYTHDQISNMKRQKVSIEKMREVVSRAGYKRVQEEDWKLK
jgi:hypothetical protein